MSRSPWLAQIGIDLRVMPASMPQNAAEISHPGVELFNTKRE
jgi:hypothetical protein